MDALYIVALILIVLGVGLRIATHLLRKSIKKMKKREK